ncbi:MAG: TRAP transporter substrate-binding protein DctP [Candidatus Tectimicrobiota bacterium]
MPIVAVSRTARLYRLAVLWGLLLGLLSSGASRPGLSHAEPVVIKFATLAPEGTPWMNIMEEMNREVQDKSAGQVMFRFYAGGVAGDERDVIRKIRINQLHGGALSGFGLGDIVAAVRVLELPQLFQSSAEADHVATALFESLAADFAQKGFVLLTLNEAGAVYLFSKEPLRSKADMARAKLWTWQGDPLPLAVFKAYGITPVPLSLPNVLPSLQSGLIDACYGTPLTILALQWFTRVKYRTDISITNVMGALLLSDALWQQLTPEQRTLLREAVQKFNAKAVATMRQYESKAVTLLQQTAGIETVTVPAEEVTRIQSVSAQVREELSDTLYPRALLERVLALRDAYRQQQR